MMILEAITSLAQLKSSNPDFQPTKATAAVLVSGQLEKCNSTNDLLDSATDGLELLESGIVDQNEFRFAIAQVEMLENRMIQQVMGQIAESN